MVEAVEVAAGVDVVEAEIVEKCERKKLIKILYSFLLYYHHVFVFLYNSGIFTAGCKNYDSVTSASDSLNTRISLLAAELLSFLSLETLKTMDLTFR